MANGFSLCKDLTVNMRNGCIAIFLGSLLVIVPAHAHHSWAGIYNTEKSIIVEGVVAEFLFRSPHPVSYTHLTLPTNREV